MLPGRFAPKGRLAKTRIDLYVSVLAMVEAARRDLAEAIAIGFALGLAAANRSDLLAKDSDADKAAAVLEANEILADSSAAAD